MHLEDGKYYDYEGRSLLAIHDNGYWFLSDEITADMWILFPGGNFEGEDKPLFCKVGKIGFSPDGLKECNPPLLN